MYKLALLAASASALSRPATKLSATATAPAPTWDDHVAIDAPPETLCKGLDGNDSMRRKFEVMLRAAQNKITSAVEELDGEGTFKQDEALASATERGVDRAAGMKPGERVPFFACA
ncbi:coproporphyrinogen oxidase [Aureococcus anophagefferens]|nr:coproporphyrinogen oxidase [Aureococcus anophagefferens]